MSAGAHEARDVRSSGSGVTGNYELPNGGSGYGTQALFKSCMHTEHAAASPAPKERIWLKKKKLLVGWK